jgi:hypothetical protein
MPEALPKRLYDYLHYRWLKVKYSIRLSFAQVSLKFPALTKPKAHSLTHPLVVSLTSYPPRFPTLAFTLRSLLRQTIKADHTVLWIAPSDAHLLPKEVLDLQPYGLEILPARDTKPYKKILPALDSFPDAFICTADDDVYYWPTWIQELIDELDESGYVVPCHRAHEITFDSAGHVRPYLEWLFDIGPAGNPTHLFPTGAGGVLYPPGILRHNSEDLEAALSLCPSNDDVWLFWIGKRNGARYRVLGGNRNFLSLPKSQKQRLWDLNQSDRGNDVLIRRMIEKYGFPDLSV